MQIKEGFLALAVAAALGAPAVYAQQDQPQDSTGAMSSSSVPGGEPGAGSSSDQAAMSEQAQSSSDSAAESSVDQQQSAAADSPASDDQQISLDQSDQLPGLSGNVERAQSDVPPPVDRETVRNVQQALKDEGQDIRVDGIWGEKTHQALMEFQRQNDLDDTGQLDAETFAALNVSDQQQTASADSGSSQQQSASAGSQRSEEQTASADQQPETQPSGSEQQSASSQ